MAENYVLLERTELSATTSSVTFANIPQTGYTDLKIVISARSDSGETTGVLYFNSDTTHANYNATRLLGEGTSGTSAASTNNPYFFYINPSSATSSTFSNIEIYIPNYTSSNPKVLSIDGVTENNGGYVIDHLGAGRWTGTAAISSIVVRPYVAGGASFVSGSTISLYGIAAVGTTPAIAPKATGGNVIATDGTYWYHAFLTSGTFTPALALSCDVLVVAGGGGGGGGASGNGGGSGGGAGGLLAFTSQSLTATNYTVTIGSGGTGGNGADGTVGSDSQFGSLTLVKGGGYGVLGVSGTGRTGGTGGSGGGGGFGTGTGGTAGSNTSGQGFNGGAGFNYELAGGGGGAAEAGNTDGSATGGDGTNSYSSWASATSTGASGYFAGGGSGGGGTTRRSGGDGGGGMNGGSGGTSGVAGTTNTGGGGGGGGDSYYYGTTTGGNGGSGITIVRYSIA